MNICILGVCGTFMANIACLAKKLGHEVVGYDKVSYPPMSDLLAHAGIEIQPMPETPVVPEEAELVLVGNSIRGDSAWPAYLEGLSVPCQSAPEWLHNEVLTHKKVIAVAGTHGKTTTTAMITRILRAAGEDVGYLIGGMCDDLDFPAHIGDSECFVIESDEYSTAYFDHGPKFMHYNPWIFLMNNLEFDHADLYPDLAAIEKVFAQGIALLPEDGTLVYGQDYPSAAKLADAATVRRKIGFGDNAGWTIGRSDATGQEFELCCCGEVVAKIKWKLCGHHNQLNALAAVAIAAQLGIEPADAADALSSFIGVRRRMQYLGDYSGVHVYDDFAHHPTSISETLHGLRAKVGEERVVALVHLASSTMRSGQHGQVKMAESLSCADEVVLLADDPVQWDVDSMQSLLSYAGVARSVEEGVEMLEQRLHAGDHLVLMGNQSLAGLQSQLQQTLKR